MPTPSRIVPDDARKAMRMHHSAYRLNYLPVIPARSSALICANQSPVQMVSGRSHDQ
jgi:hypothetical protein